MTQRSLLIKYCILQGLFWAICCVASGSINTYLYGIGVDTGMIGLLSGLAGVTATLIQPILGGIADKNPTKRGWRFQLQMFSVLLLISYIVLKLTTNHLFSGILMATTFMAVYGMFPFINSITFYYESEGIVLNYGASRGVGSLCSAATSYMVGAAVTAIGVSIITTVGIVLTLMFFALLFAFPVIGVEKKLLAEPTLKSAQGEILVEENCSVTQSSELLNESYDALPEDTIHVQGNKENLLHEAQTPVKSLSTAAFFKEYPDFGAILFGFICVFCAQTLGSGYTLQICESLGGGTTEMGIVQAIAAIVELPVMFGFSAIIARVPSYKLLRVGSIAFLLKAICYLFASSVYVLYAAQLLQMFSYGLFTMAAVYYANETASDRDKLKSQTLFGSATSIGGPAGNFLGGILIQAFGLKVDLTVAVILAVIGVTAVFMSRHLRKVA